MAASTQSTQTGPKRYYRSTDDKVIAGVCGGLAEYLNVDPTIIRVMAVIIGLFTGGAAIIGYIILAIIVPKRPGSGADTSMSGASSTRDSRTGDSGSGVNVRTDTGTSDRAKSARDTTRGRTTRRTTGTITNGSTDGPILDKK